MTVVNDTDDSLVLWHPAGTRLQMAWTPPNRSPPENTRLETLVACLTHMDWVHVEQAARASSLWFFEPGVGYAMAYFWLSNGDSLGWYVNIQEPMQRTRHGVQTMDLALDILVDREGKWCWKDEDEIAALIHEGLITADKAEWIRGEGLKAIVRIEANEPPFSEPWLEWRPDEHWSSPPVLPDDWRDT
jgi:hypothetical protein